MSSEPPFDSAPVPVWVEYGFWGGLNLCAATITFGALRAGNERLARAAALLSCCTYIGASLCVERQQAGER